MEPLVINTSFSNAIADLVLTKDYLFGSSAASFAAPGQTPITGAGDLAKYFNPLEDNTGSTKINSEWESYDTNFAGGHHVFNVNNMALTGTLDSGFNVAPTVYGNIGAFNGSTNSFTLANIGNSGSVLPTVGQIFVQTYIGIYAVTGVSGSGSGATITTTPLWGSSTGLTNFLPYEFLPLYYATTNASAGVGSTTLTFTAVPSGVTAGQFMNIYYANGAGSFMSTAQPYTVTNVTSTSVTITPALAGPDVIASGQGIIFSPPVRSGQLWTKFGFNMPGQNGAQCFAMELTAQLPQNAALYNGAGNVSGAAASGAYGAWPAFWLYGNASDGFADVSELDDLEAYNTIVRTMSSLDLNVHTPSLISAPVTFLYNTGKWSSASGLYTYTPGNDFSGSNHKYQLLVTPGMVYYFIDGQMVKARMFNWTSQRPAQIGINLAIGSLAPGLGSNNLFPVANSNFSSMHYDIYELKIWQK